MKKFTITIGGLGKETPEERKRRVQNDKANKSAVFRTKKDYNRQAYKRFEI